MYGIIDIGSNSMHLNIYKQENGKTTTVFTKETIAGLDTYIEDGQLTQPGIDKCCSVLIEYRQLLEQFNIDGYAFATAAFREATNVDELNDTISSRSGIPIYMLTDSQEAEMDFIGASTALESDVTLYVDIGGASTELIIAKDKKIVKTLGIRVGCLNMYNKFVSDLIPNRAERKNIERLVSAELSRDPIFATGEHPLICGIGGTVRAAGKLNNAVFGMPENTKTFNARNIKKLVKMLERDDDEDLVSTDTMDIIAGVCPDRVRTIMPGMIILQTIIHRYKGKKLYVSSTGAREGYLYSRVLKESKEKS